MSKKYKGKNLPSGVKPDAAVLRGPGWNNSPRLSDATSKAKKHRTPTPPDVVAEVLATSRRRCCVCFALRNDSAEKKGQIAHLDHNPSNNTPDNLAFLCLEHHDQYDSKTSQSKGLTIDELKRYRTELLASFHHHTNTNAHPDAQKKGNEELTVDTQLERLKRARYHVETRLRKRGGRASYEAIRDEVDENYSNEFLNQLIERNPKIFGRCRIKKGNKQGITLV